MIPPWCSWIATRHDDTSVVFRIVTRLDDTSVVVLVSTRRDDTSVVVLVSTRRDDTSVVVWVSTRCDDTSVVFLGIHQAWWYLRGVQGIHQAWWYLRPHIPPDPGRGAGGQTHQCGGAVVLANLSSKDKNSKRNTLNINYFISPSRLFRATLVCDRGENCARKDKDNHLKYKKLLGKIYNS